MTQNVLNHPRSTVVGVGAFGLHTILHLAPRVRFANEQRRKRNPSLPDLRQLITYTLVLPEEENGDLVLRLFVPKLQSLQSLAPLELQNFYRAADSWVAKISQGEMPDADIHSIEGILNESYTKHKWREGSEGSTPRPMSRVINQALVDHFCRDHFREILSNPFQVLSDEPPSRKKAVATLAKYQLEFGQEIEYQLEKAQRDRNQPFEDVIQSNIYLIASLADDIAGALVWPLTLLLRQRITDYPVSITGLLSTGSYSPPPSRAFEEAATFVNLHELDQLSHYGEHYVRSRANAQGDSVAQAVPLAFYAEDPWLATGLKSQTKLDSCYLFDSVKASGAGAVDEHEAVVAVGNALELFLIGNAEYAIQSDLVAGIPLVWGSAYGSLGASSKYLPVDALQDWLERRLTAEILKENMTPANEADILAWEEQGSREARELFGLSVEALGEQIGQKASIHAVSANRHTSLPNFMIDMSVPWHATPNDQLPWWRLRPNEWYRSLQRTHFRLTDHETRLVGARRLRLHLAAGTATHLEVRSQTPLRDSNNTPIYWLYEPSSPESIVDEARGVIWRDGYLAIPLSRTRLSLQRQVRSLQAADADPRGDEQSVLEQRRAELLRQVEDILTGNNYGLHYSRAWLRGATLSVYQELERLPQDDREDRSFLDRWWQRRIAIEHQLAGRPADESHRPTRGVAQTRPSPAALVTRGALLATILIIAVLGFFRLTTGALTPGLMISWGLGIVALSFSVALIPLVVYLLRSWLIRHRALDMWEESIEHAVTRDVLEVVGQTLQELLVTLDLILANLNMDEEKAQEFVHKYLDPPAPDAASLSDTPLREAVFDAELLNQVTHTNRSPITEAWNQTMEKYGSLWRAEGAATIDEVSSLLSEYGEVESENSIWYALRDLLSKFVEPFVSNTLPYDLNVEEYIARSNTTSSASTHTVDGYFNAQNYLINMGYLAKPFIALEECELGPPVVSVNLLGVYDQEQTYFSKDIVDDLRPDMRWSTHPPQLVTTRDSFSITFVRSLHGFSVADLVRWERYRLAFVGLWHKEDDERDRLAILSAQGYGLDGMSSRSEAGVSDYRDSTPVSASVE